MASGDSDHIEVMEVSVPNNASGAAGSDDEGTNSRNQFIKLHTPLILPTFFPAQHRAGCHEFQCPYFVLISFSDHDRLSLAEKNVPYDVSKVVYSSSLRSNSLYLIS